MLNAAKGKWFLTNAVSVTYEKASGGSSSEPGKLSCEHGGKEVP